MEGGGAGTDPDFFSGGRKLFYCNKLATKEISGI